MEHFLHGHTSFIPQYDNRVMSAMSNRLYPVRAKEPIVHVSVYPKPGRTACVTELVNLPFDESSGLNRSLLPCTKVVMALRPTVRVEWESGPGAL